MPRQRKTSGKCRFCGVVTTPETASKKAGYFNWSICHKCNALKAYGYGWSKRGLVDIQKEIKGLKARLAILELILAGDYDPANIRKKG